MMQAEDQDESVNDNVKEAKVFVHAYRCTVKDCRRRSCVQLQKIFQHSTNCRLWKSGRCYYCNLVDDQCNAHAKNCGKDQCALPFCLEIKRINRAKFRSRMMKNRTERMRRRVQLQAVESDSVSTPLPAAPTVSTTLPVAPSVSTTLPVASTVSTTLPVASTLSTTLPVASSVSTPYSVASSVSTPYSVASSVSTPSSVASSVSTTLPVASTLSTTLPVASTVSTPVPVASIVSIPSSVATAVSTTLPVASTVSTTLPVASAVSTTLPFASTVSTTLPVATSVSTTLPVTSSVSTTLPVASTVSTTLPVASSVSTTLPVASTVSSAISVASNVLTPNLVGLNDPIATLFGSVNAKLLLIPALHYDYQPIFLSQSVYPSGSASVPGSSHQGQYASPRVLPYQRSPPTPSWGVLGSAEYNCRLLQHTLILMFHAHRCMKSTGTLCTVPYCIDMRIVLLHIGQCTQNNNCTEGRCRASRLLLRHWDSCSKLLCPVCSPLAGLYSNHVFTGILNNPGLGMYLGNANNRTGTGSINMAGNITVNGTVNGGGTSSDVITASNAAASPELPVYRMIAGPEVPEEGRWERIN